MKAWLFLGSFVLSATLAAQEPPYLADVQFQGVLEPEDLSAVASTDDGAILIVASDEGRAVQFLRRNPQGTYEADAVLAYELSAPGNDEIDIEGIALHVDTASNESALYVAGSQCRTRSKLDALGRKQAKNLERLLSEDDPSRTGVYRLTIPANLQLEAEQRIDLRKALEQDPLLKDYKNAVTKENGIDVEGLAFDGEFLYAGLRGPVLNATFEEGPDRQYAPVAKFKFQDSPQVEMLFVDLGGRGIRDMARVDDGFLLLGGPVRDENISYQLYFWDGKNGIPGANVGQPKPLVLGEIEPPQGGKAEGVAVLRSRGPREHEVLVLFDGVSGGSPKTYRIKY